MSNPREAALMKTEAYRQQIAQWVFEGIQAYKRSQEMPMDPARIKLAATSIGTNVTPGAASAPASAKLEDVPSFRPKTNVVVEPAGSSSPASAVPKTDRAVVTEVPGFRPKTNVPTAVTSPAGVPAKSVVQGKAPEVRKAEAVEPEVRRALPVEPRKGE